MAAGGAWGRQPLINVIEHNYELGVCSLQDFGRNSLSVLVNNPLTPGHLEPEFRAFALLDLQPENFFLASRIERERSRASAT
jgi:hypothetical protein